MARKKKVEEPVEEIIQQDIAVEEAPAEEVDVEIGHWVDSVGPFGRTQVFVKDN